MRIGFAGVAHSHPFSDALSARSFGVDELAVWDPDDHSRRRDFVGSGPQSSRVRFPTCSTGGRIS
ncbi:hypothetical protein P9209_15815 [Prescottella defluvii]|nr:hypothetical protein P9209_15815 [Prescottella defluvii]